MKSRKVGNRNTKVNCNNQKKNHPWKQQQKKESRKNLVKQFEENLGLVYYFTNKWYSTAKRCGISFDELVSIGQESMWQGTLKYDSTKGKSYAGFVSWYIDAYIHKEIEKAKRHKTISLSEVIYENDNGEPVTLEDVLPGEDGSIETLEGKMCINEVLYYLKTENFSGLDRKIFEACYAIGFWGGEKPLSLSEIKKQLDLSCTRVAIWKRIKKILLRLKFLINRKKM